MAVNITATRSSTLFTDNDGDGQFDPGDVIVTRIRLTVGPGDDALGVQVNATTNGLTVDANDPNAVQVTPIAFNDFMPSITGNTPITFTAAQLLGNDVDADGAEINLTITGVSGASNGAIVNNGNGTFTFTPTTGYVGTASFQYTVADEDGLASVTTGIVTFNVTDPVWYVNGATGSDITGDGSWAKPFASLAPLSTGGTADGFDNADDTIFVYNAGTYAAQSIVLEAGQKLYGDGHAFTVNGLDIGASASNTTIGYTGVAVTLATNNTILGVSLNGTGGGAVGIQDSGSVGTLTIDNSSIIGQGKAVDIDSGGTLNVDFDQLNSSGSASEGIHLAGDNTTSISGTFSAGSGTISGAGTIGLRIGDGTAGHSGALNFSYGGNIQGNSVNAVNIDGRTGGTITLSGDISHSSTGLSGIVMGGSTGGILNLTGQSITIASDNANAVSFINNPGATVNIAPAAGGTGLDITTAGHAGLTFTGGGTLNITGASNSITTTTGQILNLQNGAMGTSGISFQSLTSGVVAAGNAININNLDAAGSGAFSGGAVTIGGGAADGINITASNSTFNFASATIDNVTGDGIEINGTSPNTTGAVTVGTVNIDGVSGAGVNIVGATNAVNINGGTIGATNDPAGDGVTITNGTGAVTVAAAITKTLGNEVVDISGHSGGAITFSGALTASPGAGGIRIVNNTGGNIDFTGNVTLNTGSLTAVNFTNTAATGANVTFSEGTLDIDTTSGIGINATSTTTGAGSLTISGADNFVNATTGRAINIEGVTTNVTLEQVGVSGGGNTTGVFLKNTGSGGQFVVTGNGTVQGSGGTIANIGGGDLGSAGAAATQGTGIYLENVSNVTLSNMIVGADGGTMTNFGIRGESVNNFTLRDSEFRGDFGSNTALDEDIIRFGTGGSSTGLTGTALFEGNNIGVGGAGNFGGLEVGLSVYVYGNNTLNLTIKDSASDQARFGENYGGTAANSYNDGTGTDGFLLESGGTSNVTVTVDGVEFAGSRGDLMQIASTGSTTQNISIKNSTFHNNQITTLDGGAGITISGSLAGANVAYNIDNNSFKGSRGANIFAMFNGSNGTVNGVVNNNDFGTQNGVKDASQANYGSLNGGSFFGGIDSKFTGNGTINYALRISNNDFYDAGRDGVIMLRSAAQDNQGAARLEATITNNRIAEVGAAVAGGVYAQVAGVGFGGQMGLNLTGNSFNLTGAAGDGLVIDNGNSASGVAYLPGYAGPYGGSPNASVSAYLTGKGNSFTNAAASGGGGTNINPGGILSGVNFSLPVPAMAANPEAGMGWQDLAVSPVTAPPRDPEPAGDAGGSAGGEMGPGGSSGGGSPGTGGSGSGSGSEPGTITPPAGDDGVLTPAELSQLVEAAIQRWIDAGATAAQVEAMRSVQFGIVDMAGIYVGASTHGVVNIDNDAGGYGWFVDSTPGEDSEFGGSGTRLTADTGGAAAGKLDLLTVIMHELGHQIGLHDEYGQSDAAELMYGYVNVGERRLPTDGEAAGAVPGSVGSTAYAIAPVNIGTVPSGKTVDVLVKSTINAQSDNFIVNLVNTATVSGSNFSNQVAQETLSLDGLTLGNMVFLDSNRDGDYDAGTDSGIVGVVVDLYADTNDSGGWDGGDAFLGTTTTTAGGLYSFAGLAPGDYIVVIKSTNFDSGGELEDLQVSPGLVKDPDDGNVDGDNNGIAATGGAVAAQTITLSYNNEGPTFTPGPGTTGNDTNNTVDFGFVQNAPPVANDDGVSVGEDSGANDLTSQVLGNDTDPENDTRTVTSATQGAHGTTSVVGGVLTYTPNANYAGPDSFTYTIDDGNGNTDTATVNVTVTGVNDAPVNVVGATVVTSEDAVDVALTGMSISDPDADPATDLVYVTFQVGHGSLEIRTDVSGGIVADDIIASATDTITVHATLDKINATLAASNGLTYTPNADFNVTDTLTVTTNDGGATGADPGAGGTADPTSEEDVDSRTITVNAVNDAPVVVGDGTVEAATIVEDTPGSGETVDSLFAAQYSDAADAQFGATNPSGSSPGAFCGVAVVANGSSPATGQWQYYNSSTDSWVDIGARSTGSALLISNTTLVRFNPALDFFGPAPTLTVHLIDNSLGYGITFGQVVDISGVGATGGTTPYSTGTVVLSQYVSIANLRPLVDLDGNDSSGAADPGFNSAYTEGAAAAAIADTDASVSDMDPDDTVEGATITITNAVAGDVLTVVGSLPGSIAVDPDSSTSTTLVLVGTGTHAEYAQALRQITFSSTSDDPTAGGTNVSRSITVTVNDGDSDSLPATATVTVTDVNDAPTGTNSTITAVEDTYRLLSLADLGFNDVDGSFASVTISAVTGGKIYVDADGSAGANPPVEATLPVTFTAQDLIDGKASFRANQDLNGAGVGSITFTVTDDDGSAAAASNVLTVNVTAQNDTPVLTTGGPIAATEQTAVAILPAGSVSDVDLDARNGGLGDYAGSTFAVNRNPATNATEDRFSLVAGPNFIIDGNALKTTGGQIFGTISVDGSAGLIVINFTSQQTAATSALVDEVIQSVRYTNISDTPPASVDLAVGFEDGSPGGGQGSGAGDLDVNVVTVNIAAVNDAPALDLNGPGSGPNATLNFSESTTPAQIAPLATVSDVDSANFDGGTLTVAVTTNQDPGDFLVILNQGSNPGEIGLGNGGTVTYGGTTIGTWSYGGGGSAQINVTFNANATPAAAEALIRQIGYFTNNDNPTTSARGVLFALTDGDGGTINRQATIDVTPVDDAPVAQPDAISTPENVIGTGSLLAENGSGPDTDADSNQITVSHVNGNAVVDGQPIVLASGAILIVNSDGTYSYNPNGKFNRLTDNSSGAVNTSAVGDTFQYTVSGGNTVTVTVTVNGVAGPGDWLMGDATDNTITGTPQADTFVVSQGGNDTVSGLASNDIFYFGGALTADDNVNGGSGSDTIVLQGDYSGGLTLDGSVTDIENISMLAGSNTAFGNPGTNLYDYALTTSDSNFAAGIQARINGSALLADEDFTFDGSAETDALFVVYGGRGQDDLTGGAGNDIFFFAEGGRFAEGDTVDGGGGYDGFFLRGNYTIDFTQAGFAGALTSIENFTVSGAGDERYARGGGSEFDYSITWDGDLLAAGATLTVNGSTLGAEESLAFNGSDETNGNFRLFGGGGNDALTGGSGADTIFGGLRGDTLTGGLGNDVFRYDSVAESNSTERDGIQDFNAGDVIDLSRIDANTLLDGNQAFTFIGGAAFSGKAGELRFENISLGGSVWEVEGDIDGDGVSDFEVILVINPPDPITSSDFIL